MGYRIKGTFSVDGDTAEDCIELFNLIDEIIDSGTKATVFFEIESEGPIADQEGDTDATLPG